jgi:hypothetical protein
MQLGRGSEVKRTESGNDDFDLQYSPPYTPRDMSENVHIARAAATMDARRAELPCVSISARLLYIQPSTYIDMIMAITNGNRVPTARAHLYDCMSRAVQV